MVDIFDSPLPRDNLRTLFNLMKEQLDLRVLHLRKGTEFENVRVSDVRTFIYASSGSMSLHDLAVALGVSRQAVHMSVKRLIDVGVIALSPAPNSKRDLVVNLTDRGQTAKREVDMIIQKFEAELAEVVGNDGLENLRTLMKAILFSSQAKNLAAGLNFKQSV